MRLPFIKRCLRRITHELAAAQDNPGDDLPARIGFAVGSIDTRDYEIEFLLILEHVCEYGWLAANDNDVIRFDWIAPYLRSPRGVGVGL